MTDQLEPIPIRVQGITVNPGESVLVPTNGGYAIRRYRAINTKTDMVRLVRDWVFIGNPDPFLNPSDCPLADLRHPDLLQGFIREVDAAE